MKVLAVCSYPIESAASRFRVEQFVAPLAECGIELSISPFLSSNQFLRLYRPGNSFRKTASMLPSIADRFWQIRRLKEFDLLFVQREAMFFGPAFFERIYGSIGRLPIVLDLDDATYIKYQSPNFGGLAGSLKFFGKTDRLIEMSSMVICGNRFIAEYVTRKGKRTVVIPTIADPNLFPQKVPTSGRLTIGWIGTKSTYPFLQTLFPVLSRLAEKYDFVVKIIGAGQSIEAVGNLEIENLEWSLEREIDDLVSFDIGLYPIDEQGELDRRWLEGKSGFKAIQYMAAGVPFVMSPVGVCAEIGVEGKTHFNARSPEDWYKYLERLLTDAPLRNSMAAAGRRHSLATYDLKSHADMLERALRIAAET